MPEDSPSVTMATTTTTTTTTTTMTTMTSSDSERMKVGGVEAMNKMTSQSSPRRQCQEDRDDAVTAGAGRSEVDVDGCDEEKATGTLMNGVHQAEGVTEMTTATTMKTSNSNAPLQSLPQFREFLLQYLPPEVVEFSLSWLERRVLPFVTTGRLLAGGVILLVAFCTPWVRRYTLFPLIRWLWSTVMRILGTAVGVAVGLGFASHVYETFERLYDFDPEEEEEGEEEEGEEVDGEEGGGSPEKSRKRGMPSRLASAARRSVGVAAARGKRLVSLGVRKPSQLSNSSQLGGSSPHRGRGLDHKEEAVDDSYTALMASAGYDLPKRTATGKLRGQIIRGAPAAEASSSEKSMYQFTDYGDGSEDENGNPPSKGSQVMRRMWPNLPNEVNDELGIFIDFIMRDYIASWYSMVDISVQYNPPPPAKDVEGEDPKERSVGGEDASSGEKAAVVLENNSAVASPKKASRMILSTMMARPAPFVEVLYDTLGCVLGTISTFAAENVNVAELVLLKVVRVISLNIKTYRELRKVALEKKQLRLQASNPSSASAAVRARLKRGIEAGLRGQPSAPNVTLPSPPSSGNIRAQSVGGLTASPSTSLTAVASATSVAAQQFASSASESMSIATEQMTAATSQMATATSQIFSSATAATTAAMAGATTATLGSLTAANPLSRSLSNIVNGSPKAANDTALDSRRHGGASLAASSPPIPFTADTSPKRNTSDKSLENRIALQSAEPPSVAKAEEDGDDEEEAEDVSEIAMIREFLLAGKLHKAITFGLDVPTLLFADPTGRDCPTPENWKEESPSVASGNKEAASQHSSWSDEDVVLHNRLFGANRRLLYESELDYNRVVAHRMCRILLPRTDFASPVVRSMTVEMLASSVLSPTMDTFVPPSINQMIVDGMEAAAAASEETEEGNDGASVARRVSTNPEEEKALEVAATAALAEVTTDEDEEDHERQQHEAEAAEAGAMEKQEEEQHADKDEEGDKTETLSSGQPEQESLAPENDDSNDNAVLDESGFARSESEVSAFSADSDEDKASESDEGASDKEEPTDGSTTPPVSEGIGALESEQPTEPIHSDDDMAGIDGDIDDDPSDDDLGHDVFDEEAMDMGEGDADAEGEADVDNVGVDKPAGSTSASEAMDQIFTLVTMSLMELQSFFDFDDARMARERNDEIDVDWDDRRCRGAVNQLVLVIEAALLHGLCDRTVPQMPPPPLSNEGATPPPPPPDAPSLSMFLMEMTSDLDSFRQQVEEAEEEMEANPEAEPPADTDEKVMDPTSLGPTELRTMRTLIAAWLHTGKVYSTLNLVLRATRTKVLSHFYCRHAFIRDPDNSGGFARQLRAVEGVEILVDTMSILSQRPLDLSKFGIDADTSREEEDDGDDHPPSAPATESPASPRGFFPNPASAIMGAATKGVRLDRSSGNLLGRAFDKNRQQGENASTPQRKGLRIGGAIRQQTDLQKVTGNFAGNMKAGFQNNRQRLSRLVSGANADGSTPVGKFSSNQQSSTPTGAGDGGELDGGDEEMTGPIGAHLEFSRNQAFAASLRLERERRLESWAKVTESASSTTDGGKQQQQQPLEMVCRTRGSTEKDVLLHKEMHHLSRWFYTGTNVLCLRSSAANRAENGNDAGGNGGSEDANKPSTLLIMETVCNRRRIEVPDDDSSFLLRAQPRQLNPLGVHRDQRNHENSYKSFAAYYEEPVIHPRTKKYHGGKCYRRCVLKYFPSNRTASASLVQESRRLDYRKGRAEITPGDFKAHEVRQGFGVNSGAVLTEEFQSERHSCNKAAQRTGGAGGAGSILSSPVMDMTDFNSVPRTGKAMDFVYRVALFEKPCIELAGKKFIVQDSSITGPHRADASSLEISDAALSLALLMYGPENVTEEESGAGFQIVTGPDGAPMVLMKLGGGEKDGGGGDSRQTRVEVRPYRPSFIRAALYVTSARQEAQLQCLMSCVRTSTARNATKAKTEALLQPTMCLLDYANSTKREKQSILLRDLKLGINHIDREQLRRNCILLPRYPTLLRGLKALVEAAVPVRSVPGAEAMGPPGMILFRIRCVAISEVLEITEEFSGHGDVQFVREEWVVYRPFRDFSILHKHLKTQVAATEASAGTGARIVGAATAAFTEHRQRQRKRLIPSLGQATKAGALGVTKKALEKRREILNGYITYLLGRDNLLSRSPEVLRFLGAYDPLPAELRLGSSQPQAKVVDSLGRTQMKRTVVDHELVKVGPLTRARISAGAPLATTPRALPDPANPGAATPGSGEKATPKSRAAPTPTSQTKSPTPKTNRVQALQEAMKASLNSRLDKVKLAQVRTVVFDLIRYLFDIDNASFFRSRMFGALKTMSFAVTSAQEFRKTLVKMHVTYLSPEALGGYIKMGRDILWPNGVFFTSSPEKTPAEKKALAKKTREMLPQAFPDQLKTLLGQEISDDGINVLHEMLQNRVVLKSMAYMIMDLVWLEIFPELNDVLHGASALDGDDA